jgi:AraC-like DNA-binding protein
MTDDSRPSVAPAQAGTISVCFVASALKSARASGLNTEALLAGVQLSPTLLDHPRARVSAAAYGALWRAIALALDDEFFGQDARRMKAGSFAMLCHTVIQCRTLGQALERSVRFYGVMLDDISVEVIRDGRMAKLVLHERPQSVSRIFAHELMLIELYGMACWLVRRRIPIARTEFSYSEPPYSAEYRLMFCDDLRFNCSHTALSFDASYLDLPVAQDERSTKSFLRTAPESILLKYKNPNSLSVKIRRRLRVRSLADAPNLKALAGELAMSPATLINRLKSEGTSYQEIKDQLRRDLATRMLSDSNRTVLEVALELGFSERSAFHRAFRKWTGRSPGEFRRSPG